MQLLAIDPDPGAKLGPVMTHDFELSCDGQQLGRRRVFNLYCKLFHVFILSFDCVRFVACGLKLATCSLSLISFRNFSQLLT